VLSLVDSVVVVKSFEHGQYEVPDTDSLFVLEDRKVLGLVRPTCHLIKGFRVIRPLGLRNLWSSDSTSLLPPVPFRLRFARSTPDYQTGTKVYYCPSRSAFSYTSAIRLQQGDDASDIYDEGVGEDELDFSDDEKEAEWNRRKGKG